MSNNSNPHDVDGEQVRNKSRDNDVVRATVIDVIPDIHSVRVNPRGDNAPTVAPVLTPMYGMQMLPQEKERVTLLYITENVPVVIGGVYLADGPNPPQADEGDAVFGNESGSAVTVHEDGHISVVTEGRQAVDIDHQSASVSLEGANQTIAAGDTDIIQFDTVEEDLEDIWNLDNDYKMTARADGLHRLTASVALPSPGQNNIYEIRIFVNNVEEKRVTRQSAVNEEMSLQVTTMERLETGDKVDIRVTNNSGASREILADDITTEFDFRRAGI